jgi:hypothetical protein
MNVSMKVRIAVTVLGAATLVLAGAGIASAASGGTVVPGVQTLTAAACTSVSCAAVGDNADFTAAKSAHITVSTGKVTEWSGSTKGFSPNAVACASKTACIAVSDDQAATVSPATAAMKVTGTFKTPKGDISAVSQVSCTPSYCVAVGFQGGSSSSSYAVLAKISLKGKILSLTKITKYTGMGVIWCLSKTTCLASAHSKSEDQSYVAVITGAKLKSVTAIPAGTFIQRIACYGASLCYALGGPTTGYPTELFPLNPKTGKPGKAIPLAKDMRGTGIACYAKTKCIVVGYDSAVTSNDAATDTISSGKVGALERWTTDTEAFSAVACATKACYAVGPDDTSTVTQSIVIKV